ncbi:unnamed protein product, partial [Prorocentrum cordatum]
GEQWQRALALLSEMREAKLEPDVFSPTWPVEARARSSLGLTCTKSPVYGATTGPNRSGRPSQLHRWDQRVREGRAVAAGPGRAERDAGGEAGARRLQLHRWDQRVREGRAVAAGPGRAERDAGGEAGALRYLSYSVGVSACEKGQQWQRAWALISEMRKTKLKPNAATSYNAGVGAGEQGEKWQWALALMSKMQEAKL